MADVQNATGRHNREVMCVSLKDRNSHSGGGMFCHFVQFSAKERLVLIRTVKVLFLREETAVSRIKKMTALFFVPKLKMNCVYIYFDMHPFVSMKIMTSQVRINDPELQTTWNPVYTSVGTFPTCVVRVLTLEWDRGRGADTGGWSDQGRVVRTHSWLINVQTEGRYRLTSPV